MKNIIYFEELEEEQFGSVQVLNIDEYKLIEQEKYVNISSKLKLCTSLKEIYLRFENLELSVEGFEFILQALQNLQNLTTFKIQFINFKLSDKIFLQLGLYLNTYSKLEKIQLDVTLCKVSSYAYLNLVKQFVNIPNLFKLKLEFIDNDCNDQLQNLMEEIKFQKLKKIKIFQSKLNEENSNFCINLSECKDLRQVFINLQDSLVNDKQLICYSQKLSKLNQIVDLKLNLENNQIQNNGIIKLTDSISQLNSIEILYLKLRNNQISKEGLQYFFLKLKQNQYLENLTFLLSKNRVEGDISQVFEYLSEFQSLKKLELVLDENKIEFNQELSINTVNFCKQLSELNLSLNKCSLSQKSLNNIINGLTEFQSIRNLTLQLQYNYIGTSYAQAFKEQLCRFNQLNKLQFNLDDNIGCKECVLSIASILTQFSCLKYLNLGLSNCHLGNDQVQELIENLSKLPSLVGLQIDLQHNQVNYDHLINISNKIRKFRKLQSIKMPIQFKQNLKLIRAQLLKCLRLCSLQI
ncbi:hypothetical protein TTHERM_000312119 (macronuclear) [Tetrahymena thermophila SB210]|uniref:Kinase domain protein n=1 Tax=Tetrahymena thermophila (strain SB210) TaxID=312017 RepID=W7X759_TETTS|nr:hypothetical protein TTHERM_000312119 [Tetrahymena thermophila SB210]EWS72233.1 hypothetical protein TTHERM_000312119 [Tetrahymena thermophila SB210]|eukprot:XP_012655173.1 hypothetical protein TTHERM_000312119 [Tetrahymena thermophila SB210]